MALWQAERPLILASKSAARRAILEAAAIPCEIDPAAIDERAIEAHAGALGPGQAAALLAREKASAIAAKHPGRLVLGADQTLALGERRFSKAPDRAGARAQLTALRGRTHALHSAVAVARSGEILFEHVDAAHLTMREFTDAFLDAYLDAVGDKALASVGGYQLEGTGIQLFERVEGDHFTVLGLPLLPLLAWLRSNGLLAE
ncbi:MAG: septum formation inhibitor Maf [Alphaproteobacteria bacterium]|nr:septum formation inhibitor Maf [Alphaproteobacteria bacterium]